MERPDLRQPAIRWLAAAAAAVLVAGCGTRLDDHAIEKAASHVVVLPAGQQAPTAGGRDAGAPGPAGGVVGQPVSGGDSGSAAATAAAASGTAPVAASGAPVTGAVEHIRLAESRGGHHFELAVVVEVAHGDRCHDGLVSGIDARICERSLKVPQYTRCPPIVTIDHDLIRNGLVSHGLSRDWCVSAAGGVQVEYCRAVIVAARRDYLSFLTCG